MGSLLKRGVPTLIALSLLAGCGSSAGTPGAATGAASPGASAQASGAASSPDAVVSAVPSPSPSPSPSPLPSPSPSPLPSPNVGSALGDLLRGTRLSATADVTGEMVVGSARYAVVGSLQMSGLDSRQVLTVRRPGGVEEEIISSYGQTYRRVGSGPFFQQAAAAGAGVADLLHGATVGSSATPDTKAGQSLYRLALTAPAATPAAFGIHDTVVGAPTWTIDVWARVDGSPVIMDVAASWRQKSAAATVPVTLQVELTFTTGVPVGVTTPADVWVLSASKKFHYQIGRPSDWVFEQATKKRNWDATFGSGYAWADIQRFATKGTSLVTLARYVATAPAWKIKSFKLESVKATTLAGVAARRISLHGTYKSTKQYIIDILAVKGGYFYEIAVFDKRGNEAAARALADRLIATFSFK